MTCMLVDDNSSFIETAAIVLHREGMTVAGTASTVADAVRQVAMLRPDVVLVDIELGGESGFEVARRLAANAGPAGTAVIMISTGAEADYADLIAESPVAGFLPKAELSAAGIWRILGAGGQRASEAAGLAS